MTTRWQKIVYVIVIVSYSRKCGFRLHYCLLGLQEYFLNTDHPYFLLLLFLLPLNIF